MKKLDFVVKYNSNSDFSQSVDDTHDVVHERTEKIVDEGHVDEGRQNYMETCRDYGAWTHRHPMANYLSSPDRIKEGGWG